MSLCASPSGWRVKGGHNSYFIRQEPLSGEVRHLEGSGVFSTGWVRYVAALSGRRESRRPAGVERWGVGLPGVVRGFTSGLPQDIMARFVSLP